MYIYSKTCAIIRMSVRSWLENFIVTTGSNGELFHYVPVIMKKVTFSRFSCQNCRKFCLTFDEVILSRFSSPSLPPFPSIFGFIVLLRTTSSRSIVLDLNIVEVN